MTVSERILYVVLNLKDCTLKSFERTIIVSIFGMNIKLMLLMPKKYKEVYSN